MTAAPREYGGVTLEAYAGVVAALAEGFPLAEVLRRERIPSEQWGAAEPEWKRRLAEDGATGGPYFALYQERLTVAEECLSRAVAPIDDGLEAWLAFLDGWAKSAEPRAYWQEKLGLNVNDVSRLRRRRQKRMAEDTEVAIAAAETAARGAGPLPPLRIAPAALRPFPWSKGGGAAPPIADGGSAGSAPAAPADEEFLLDRYARISAELAAFPRARAAVFGRHGLTEATFRELESRWRPALTGVVGADYRRLVAHHRARLDAGQKAALSKSATAAGRLPPAPPPASAAPPQQANVPPAKAPLANMQQANAPLANAPLANMQQANVPPANAPLANIQHANVPQPAMLPRAAPTTEPPPPSVGSVKDETELYFAAISDDDALPFVTAVGISPSVLEAFAQVEPHPGAGETAYATPAFADEEVLPFMKPAEPEARPPSSEGPEPARSPPAATPDVTGASPPAPHALRQLVAVSVELGLAPTQAVAILRHYGLTPSSARDGFAAMEAERRRDPAVQAEWELAHAEYTAYRRTVR